MDISKKLIGDYLKTQRLMSLATYGAYPWIASVYYVHDDELNLYFLSKPWREHCEALKVNNKVAVSIADSSQPIHKTQKGLQLWGEASEVSSITQVKWMFRMWNKLISNNGGEKLIDPKKFLDAGTSKIYKIKPKRIKFFNTELWPKEQTQILEL